MLSIGITTFKRRLKIFKILLENIRQIDPDIEINVTVNAEYQEGLCDDYRRRLLQVCAEHKNVNVFTFPTFTGLAKMWNYLVINSSNEYNMIMNDDTALVNGQSLDRMKKYISQYKPDFALSQELLFSCFVISKELLDDIGYFDERFLAFGEEDGDFMWRYKKKYNKDATLLAKLGCAAWELDGKNASNVRPTSDTNPKPWFNADFMYKKYKPDPNGILGWFPEPYSPVISDERQYPYESFKRKYYSRLNG